MKLTSSRFNSEANFAKSQMLSERSFEAEARTPPSRLKLRLVTRLEWCEKSPTRWPWAMSHTARKRTDGSRMTLCL